MVSAVRAITATKGWNMGLTQVWVDYISIPQRNKFMQIAAINSLGSCVATKAYANWRSRHRPLNALWSVLQVCGIGERVRCCGPQSAPCGQSEANGLCVLPEAVDNAEFDL